MGKSNVTLRQKEIANGRISLYLDFYPPILNSKTNKYSRREFLKIYLYKKPRDQIQKTANIENLRTAQLLHLKKQNELNKEDIYTQWEKEQLQIQAIGEESFLTYFKNLRDKKSGANYNIWYSAIVHFETFLNGEDLQFKNVSISLIEDYKDYLLKAKNLRGNGNKIAKNTALSYYNKIKTTLKKAYKEGKLRTDINASVESIPEQESKRNFLTLEEAKQLFKTPCSKEIVYRISMFSTLTGMRYSDIAKLKWSEIEYIKNDGYYIRFTQKKTEGHETMPISDDAFAILGARGENKNKVFPNLKKWDVDRVLPVWIAKSGITKHITFHCFRHTYATLQLTSGTDLFTISKMLGHKNIKTTQIYAKIIDKKKRETTAKIDLK
ncbi:tyrosine-type recombinase/integrase [Flavobacterium sp. MAHUQ-51]|uniref:tyrosine-type recombinase/integrase n=1 Tax=Flavobacterium sp. GCM10022190 TaxID=3252639 RepID=UPI003622C30C